VRVKGKEVHPSYVKTQEPRYQERANDLIALFERGVSHGKTRSWLAEQVDDLIGDGVDHKLTKGLAKTLLDRSEFAVESPIPPAELRAKLFDVSGRAPSRAKAAAAIVALGTELGLTPDAVRDLLYADRKEEQRILSCDAPDGDWLLQRYNTGLVQAVLIKAVNVQVALDGPSPERARQLFRLIQFNGLMYSVLPTATGYRIHLDGPASILRHSTRYGMSLATWFPGLLLQECPWRLDATVLWGRKRKFKKTLSVDSTQGLKSHHRDTGAYMTRTEQWFQERFLALSCGWRLSREGRPINLQGKGVVVPNFTFRKGRKVAHLEIVGFWRKDWLRRRLDLLNAHGPGNLILAVSSKLAVTQEVWKNFPGQVVSFKEVVPSKDVLAAVEACAKRG
jgi:predicted nuclease of restriction endonuclease-like RecB superfamily